MSTTDQAIRAAAFLAQALELELDPETIEKDLTVVNSEGDLTTYAIELDASFGSAAFLIYVYRFVGTAFGGSGRTSYDTAIGTLQTAAARNAPGPRLLANGESDTEGFLLATTPTTYRLMTGEPEPTPDTAAPPPTREAAAEVRRDSAQALLTHLRGANAAASQWLAAIQNSNAAPPTDDPVADTIAFNEDETELALFLLDERSIQNVLKAVNLFITAARDAARDTN